MDAQLALASQLRAVSVERVAKQVIESHFLRDIRGNLVAFSGQLVQQYVETLEFDDEDEETAENADAGSAE